MDDNRVSTLSSETLGGANIKAPLNETLTWVEFAESQCPYYIAMGITADEYWNGDYSLLKYYRKADKIKKQAENERLWLQGLYVYDAICCCVPVLRAFSKARKPDKYPQGPYPIYKEENNNTKNISKNQKQSGTDKAKAMMEMWAINFNKKFMEKQKKKRGE